VYGSIFDPNGDAGPNNLLACKRFTLFSSGGTDFKPQDSFGKDIEGVIERRSGRLGSLAEPNWPPMPPLNEGQQLRTDNYSQGWVIDSTLAVTRWNMTYLDVNELPKLLGLTHNPNWPW